MAHFARIDKNNIVQEVIVIDPELIASGAWGDPAQWIQTSYNTNWGQHAAGGPGLRKNFAAHGMTYDPVRDAFIPIKPYPSWTLDEETCQWIAPIPMPTGEGRYQWSEEFYKWSRID